MAQKISLKIVGHTYNLTAANEDQEQLYRFAAEAINNRFAAYTRSHPGRTPMDMLSMVALSETVIRLGLQKEIDTLKQGESQLEMDLEKYLRDIQ